MTNLRTLKIEVNESDPKGIAYMKDRSDCISLRIFLLDENDKQTKDCEVVNVMPGDCVNVEIV